MRYSEYKLPPGVHPAFEPKQTGVSPDTKDKAGNVVAGKPIFEPTVVKIREAETLAEFGAELVEQDQAEAYVLGLAQGAYDILAQRTVREWLQSQEVSDLMDGKDPATKDLDEDERRAHVLGLAQDIANEYRKGGRPAGTGGERAAAKKALAKEKAVEAAAASNPEIAELQRQMREKLAALGVAV